MVTQVGKGVLTRCRRWVRRRLASIDIVYELLEESESVNDICDLKNLVQLVKVVP